MRLAAACLLLLLAAACGHPEPSTGPVVTVFAAASLKTALDQVGVAVIAPASLRWRVTYAASSTLARQIEAGAPADLFISADQEWMDHVQARGFIRPGTRVTLLGNTLVLIAPADSATRLRLEPGAPLRATLGDGRLALADPAVVPAGKYARAALLHLGLWDQVADRVAPADHVRAALALVARGEAPLGIVYGSDARAEPRVRVVDRIAAQTHPPIHYPAALTSAAGPDAAAVLRRLQEPAASEVFTAHGLRAPVP